MNTLYANLSHAAHQNWLADDSYDDKEDFLIRLVVKECLTKMSDYIDKQRVLKHFGMEE
jgi:hypothetical protein